MKTKTHEPNGAGGNYSARLAKKRTRALNKAIKRGRYRQIERCVSACRFAGAFDSANRGSVALREIMIHRFNDTIPALPVVKRAHFSRRESRRMAYMEGVRERIEARSPKPAPVQATDPKRAKMDAINAKRRAARAAKKGT